MKNVCLKSFLLGLVLTLPLSTYSTWVGTIATAHKNNVTIAAAVAGALVATMYAGTGNNEEHAHVLHEWAQTNHGRWFFRLIGAYNNPKRALYAYRLFTIITGALAGTALGYGIAHYFSSGRATDLAQMIVGSVAVHPFVEGKPAVNGKEIIDMSSDYTEFPLYGALNTISHSKEKLTNAHHLAENVLNNTKAEIHEKTTCGELVEKIKVFIKNLVASERTILKDSQFNKEQIIMIERTKAIIAQDKMRWAAHHRANAEREETWQWQRREANRLQAERNTWLRNNLTFQPPWTVTVTIKNKKN